MKENTRHLSTRWNNALLTQKRDRARLASVVAVGSYGQQVSPESQPIKSPIYTLLLLQWKDAVPSAWRTVVSLSKYLVTHTLKQNESALIEAETGKDIPI